MDFPQHGRPARWHYEEETPHPVLQARYAGDTWDGYCEDRLERWTRFVAEVEAADEARIVESTLLQTPIMTMLREDVDPAVILGFLGRLQTALSSLKPLLIYLRPLDADESKAPGAFDAESWPLKLHFEEDDDGSVVRIRAVGPPLGRGRIDGVFERT